MTATRPTDGLVRLPAPHPGDDRRRGLLGWMASTATERVVTTIDLDALLKHVDVQAVLDRVDVQQLLDRLDLDAVLRRVDVDALVGRVDVQALVERIDLQPLLDRVDVQRVVDRVDVEAVVSRSGIPDVVAASTRQVADSTVDGARRQLAGLDTVAARLVDRLLRRRPDPAAAVPPRLRRTDPAPVGAAERLTVTGHGAGPLSRAAAAILDILVVTGSYALLVAGVGVLAGSLLGVTMTRGSSPWATAGLLLWGFTYAVVSGAVAGRTLGKGLVGLRIVRADGDVVPPSRVVVRTLLYPVCAAFAGLGFLPVILHRQHRGAHDLVAGTAVVYDWGERPAELPGPLSAYLTRRRVDADLLDPEPQP